MVMRWTADSAASSSVLDCLRRYLMTINGAAATTMSGLKHKEMRLTRVLVAEDDKEMRAILKLSLEKAGYEVEAVADGARAVRAHEERPADLVITDLFMPDRDGLETVEYFRARHPRLPIVAISGWKIGQKTDHLRVAQVAGANAVLRKPFTMDELLDRLQGLIARIGSSTDNLSGSRNVAKT